MPEQITLYELVFKKPAGTSRGILHTKPSWIYEYALPNGKTAQTEFPVIPGLSPEFQNHHQYEKALKRFLAEAQPHLESLAQTDFFSNQTFQQLISKWQACPSFIFGLEILIWSMQANGSPILLVNAFTRSQTRIPINGLVWMGTLAEMRTQAIEKIAAGFSVVKLKIGALDWQQELLLLKELRASAAQQDLTIRVDANGAFSLEQVAEVLEELAALQVHSIEQPIAVGQREQLAALCLASPLPIALDEELIGICSRSEKIALLEQVKPQYIILKPSLHGGFSGVKEWIFLAEERQIGWWLTSALESAIGLNAIVQFGASYAPNLAQGFGTGGLFTNNFPSQLAIEKGHIYWLNGSDKS
jgi:L-alanine-DL-glutamate epimerase-like enolase superfamily enzyme